MTRDAMMKHWLVGEKLRCVESGSYRLPTDRPLTVKESGPGWLKLVHSEIPQGAYHGPYNPACFVLWAEQPERHSTEALTTERGKTHGDWFEQSLLQNLIKSDLHGAARWHLLTASQKEALDMIAVKVSRIVSGNPAEPDHWDDIMGYALLGKNGGHSRVDEAVKTEESRDFPGKSE